MLPVPPTFLQNITECAIEILAIVRKFLSTFPCCYTLGQEPGDEGALAPLMLIKKELSPLHIANIATTKVILDIYVNISAIQSRITRLHSP